MDSKEEPCLWKLYEEISTDEEPFSAESRDNYDPRKDMQNNSSESEYEYTDPENDLPLSVVRRRIISPTNDTSDDETRTHPGRSQDRYSEDSDWRSDTTKCFAKMFFSS